MEQIKLDIVPVGIAPVAHASQFDNGRQIRFNLFNQGTPYTLTGAETVTMVVNGEEENITNTSDNYVIWDVAEEDCAEVGVIGCEIRIVLGSMLIGSKNFFLEVEMDPYDGKNVRIVTVGPADICTFETTLAEPLQSVTVDIVATGGNGTPDNPNPINGYSEANITRCGVNLWDEEWEVGGYNNSTGVPTAEVDRIRNKNHIPCKGGLSVYITYPSGMSGGIYVYFWDSTDTLISVAYANSGNSFTFTTPADTAYFNFNTQSYYGATYNDNLSFNYPSTDTTYHAYTGNTYTIAFGQTVYGGQSIVLPDRTYFHATHAKYTGTWGDGVAEYAPDTMPDMKRRTFMLSPIAGTAADNNGKAKCNITDVFSTANNLNSPHFYVYDNFYLYAPRTLDDSTPVQCSYVLATPFDIDLTPEVISAIVGENNVFAGCGQTTVKYLKAGE